MPTPPTSPKMLTPHRSPGRRPPLPVMPPSTQSLTGMEKVVPPGRPLVSRSTGSSQSDLNKALPPPPAFRRPSSSYSTDSGYTRIVESYESDDEAITQPPTPAVPQIPPLHQPNAYRETISGLLSRRLREPPSPRQMPSIPSPQQSSPVVSPPLSADEDRFAASFGDLSLRSDSSHSHRVSPLSSPRPQEFRPASSLSPQSPKFQTTVIYRTSANPTISLSPRLPPPDQDPIDPNIVPRPLNIRPQSHLRSPSYLPSPRSPTSAPAAPAHPDQNAPHSHFSTSSDTSSSEYVIYTSIRDSLRAYMREKRRKKQLAKLDKQNRRILSTISAKYPAASKSTYDLALHTHGHKHGHRHSNSPSHRRGSWTSSQRRASVQSLVQGVYERVRRFSAGAAAEESLIVAEGGGVEIQSPPPTSASARKRRGSKQRAVPTSPYQKYGAVIWEVPRRSERKKEKMRKDQQKKHGGHGRGHKRGPSSDPLHVHVHDVSRAFASGQSGLVAAMGMGKKEGKRKMTADEKWREEMKGKIQVVGPTEVGSPRSHPHPHPHPLSVGGERSGDGGADEQRERERERSWI